VGKVQIGILDGAAVDQLAEGIVRLVRQALGNAAGFRQGPVQFLADRSAGPKVDLEVLLLDPFSQCSGTALGYPAGVNPLVPIFMPGLMIAAASSAVTILACKALQRTRSLISIIPISPLNLIILLKNNRQNNR
jgi:hypothetical protein